jgi:ATP-binding cassette subfamily B protein
MTDRDPRRAIRRKRRLFIGEVIQTSAMDCGPAALKAVAEGFGLPVSYGRLREACHTDVDGTSIDTVESLAGELGLHAEQVLLPVDQVLATESAALPGIIVTSDPAGGAHFVVAWNQPGPFVQVMDPARGRLWLRKPRFLASLYVHAADVPAADWRAWAGTPEFIGPLRGRLTALRIARAEQDALLGTAEADPTWRGLATLDAAARMVAALRRSGAIGSAETPRALRALTHEAVSSGAASGTIPDHFWSARSPGGSGESPHLTVEGAVVVRVRAPKVPDPERPQETPGAVSLEVKAALEEPPLQPLRNTIAALRADGVVGPLAILCALGIATAGVLLEAILLRSVLDAGTFLRMPEQGILAGLLLGAFAMAMLALEFALGAAEQRAGRHLEARLRIAFMDKLPRLADAYFQSRPVSDMAERCHAVHTLRTLPQLSARMLRVCMELTVTAIAIVWLDPGVAGLAITAAIAAAGIPLAGQVVLAERDLRVRTHAGALGRFHLDALLGRKAIEAHGAAATIEREHEGLLSEWSRASLTLLRGSVAVEGLQMFVGFGLAAAVIFGHFADGAGGGMLLLAYWVLNLPVLGYELALYAREYPAHRSTLLRLLEPLGAPEADRRPAGGEFPVPSALRAAGDARGVRIEARGLSVRAAGQQIIEKIDVQVDSSRHVAIVGASGAGKSTLLGTLLGWHRPSQGTLLVDGRPLDQTALDALRLETAWVDPTVQIWNAPLLDNLSYGTDAPEPLAPVLEAAGLIPVIARLPRGLSTPLGEGGSLLSAGEAQRVRLARAMLKRQPRLVVLDEPFMGLERGRRRQLLTEMRQRWASSTLLYVTHEVSEARAFDRVLVLDRGRIVEDGDPRVLAQMPSSRYRRLLQAQDAAHARFGAGTEWQRVRLEDGRLVRDSGGATVEQTA